MLKMNGISKKEIKMIAELEFKKKYFFTREDIKPYFQNKTQMRDTIYNLHKKGRIVTLNRNKYYLIPIKAKSGSWAEHPYVLADEMFDGNGYFIGGWDAANYWRLTDQIPMKISVWTTKRQGTIKVLNTTFIFRRATKKKMSSAVLETIDQHSFRILNKKASKKWLSKRDW